MLQAPLQIVLGKYIPDLAKAEVEKAAAVLQEFHTRIISCRVSVTMQGERHRTGGLYDVHITVGVPRHADIVVRRCVSKERERLGVAIRRAFHEARRQLQDAE